MKNPETLPHLYSQINFNRLPCNSVGERNIFKHTVPGIHIEKKILTTTSVHILKNYLKLFIILKAKITQLLKFYESTKISNLLYEKNDKLDIIKTSFYPKSQFKK